MLRKILLVLCSIAALYFLQGGTSVHGQGQDTDCDTKGCAFDETEDGSIDLEQACGEGASISRQVSPGGEPTTTGKCKCWLADCEQDTPCARTVHWTVTAPTGGIICEHVGSQKQSRGPRHVFELAVSACGQDKIKTFSIHDDTGCNSLICGPFTLELSCGECGDYMAYCW